MSPQIPQSEDNVLVTVCARGGSKGVPNKNLRHLRELPLIAWTLNAASEFTEHIAADIVVSTEDLEILEVARRFGVNTDYQRPMRLAGDSVGKVEVIQDVLLHKEAKAHKRYDLILDLDVSSPLRTLEDILNAYSKIRSSENTLTLCSVSQCHRNPYFNMVEQSDSEHVKLCKIPEKTVLARQNAPEVYDINGSLYFYRRSFFDEKHQFVITENRTLAYRMDHVCFDVDTPLDLKLLKFLVEENHLDFTICGDKERRTKS